MSFLLVNDRILYVRDKKYENPRVLWIVTCESRILCFGYVERMYINVYFLFFI
jgi:hypothetical protein